MIGSGASGVGAFQRLKSLGVPLVTLLEGSPTLGGRLSVFSLPPSLISAHPGGRLSELFFERGGNWLHGFETGGVAQVDHPLYELVKDAGLKYRTSNYESFAVLDESGLDVTQLYKERQKDFGDAMDKAMGLASEKLSSSSPPSSSLSESDISIRSALSLFGWRPSSALDGIVEWMEIDFENAEGAETVSLIGGTIGFATYDIGEDDCFVTDKRGYYAIFEKVLSKLTKYPNPDPSIQTNKVVTSITYNNDGAVVKTADGSEYPCDGVIVTAGLGNLQRGSITFSPPLPSESVEQTAGMTLGHYVKVVAVYDPVITPFWNKARLFTLLAMAGPWRLLIDMEQMTGDSAFRTTLGSHVAAADGEALLEMTDLEILESWIAMTRRIFGDNVPSPIFFDVPRWESNSLHGGAYSDWNLGISPAGRQAIKAPKGLGGRLSFAGEHTSYQYFGYVHGAYLSGVEGAEALVACATGGDCEEGGSDGEERGGGKDEGNVCQGKEISAVFGGMIAGAILGVGAALVYTGGLSGRKGGRFELASMGDGAEGGKGYTKSNDGL